MKACLIVAAAALVLAVFSAGLWALEVKADKENVVAGRLEGKWGIHPLLTKRLTGRKDVSKGESMFAGISFTSDPSVAERIPAKYDQFLEEKRIYMAGTVRLIRAKDHPFILIQYGGNPRVVYFRERDGDPMGDEESFNVMLAPAKDKAKDLLFIGGDFNNQPFLAYERVKD